MGYYSLPEATIKPLPFSRLVSCNSIRVSLTGRTYFTCDDEFYVDGYPSALSDKRKVSEASDWAPRDLSRLSLVGVDGEGNCAFLDKRQGVPIVKGCSEVWDDLDNPFDSKKASYKELAGAGVFLPTSPSIAIERVIQGGKVSLLVNMPSKGGVAGAGAAGAGKVTDRPSVKLTEDAKEVLDVEADALGWLLILYRARSGYGVVLWNPRDQKPAAMARIEDNGSNREDALCAVSDGAAGIWVGYRNGMLEHYRWDLLP